MDKLNTDRGALRKFCLNMGIAFLLIALLVMIRHKHNPLPISIISIVFFISAFIIPNLLKPIYILWMRFALVLSWVNTRLILLIIFYLIFTPIGLAMRLFGIDLLERKSDKNKKSYWKKKEKKSFSRLDYERQF